MIDRESALLASLRASASTAPNSDDVREALSRLDDAKSSMPDFGRLVENSSSIESEMGRLRSLAEDAAEEAKSARRRSIAAIAIALASLLLALVSFLAKYKLW